MDGVLNEKIIKLLGCTFCTDSYITFDHTASGGDHRRGDHSEHVPVTDDPGHYHDHPGASGICYFSVASADNDAVSPGYQRIHHAEHSVEFRFLRPDHQGIW